MVKKGYEGEVQFDRFYENCPKNWLILNDLWLKNNNSAFQIDSLLLTPKINYLFDVKNYCGDYEFRNNIFYKNGKETSNNPLTQLQRCDTSFRYFINKHDFQIPTVSNLVFVNKEFTLYGITKEPPIILPTQINRFFDYLKKKELNVNRDGSTLKPTESQVRLANQLLSLQLTDPPITNLPSYHFESLQKGIICDKCKSFLAGPKKFMIKVGCHQCGYVENVKDSILRSIREFKLIFPSMQITTKSIIEWCKVIEHERRIIRTLNENFTRIGNRKGSYYV